MINCFLYISSENIRWCDKLSCKARLECYGIDKHMTDLKKSLLNGRKQFIGHMHYLYGCIFQKDERI